MKPETVKAIANMVSIAELVTKARSAAQPDTIVGRPEGGITIREYADLIGISASTAKRDLDRLVSGGEYEKITAIALTSGANQKVTRQMFYREVLNAVDRIR
jgi:hypothetical protein